MRRIFQACVQYRVCAVPILAALVFIIGAGGFYGVFVSCKWGLAGCSPVNVDLLLQRFTVNPDPSLQYATRLTWAYMLGLHTAVCVSAIVAGGFTIAQSLSGYRIRHWSAVIGLALICAGATSVILIWTDYQVVVVQLLKRTVLADIKNVIGMTRIIDAFSFFTALFLAGVSGIILAPPPDCREQTGTEIAVQMKRLRLILYVGTAVLVFGVFQVSALYNWAVNFLLPAEENKVALQGLQSLVSSLVNTRGVYYTIFLAIIYLPSAIILRKRAIDLADKTFPEKSLPEREEWLKYQGLSLSFFGSLPQMSVILGPLLSGPIGVLLKYLH